MLKKLSSNLKFKKNNSHVAIFVFLYTCSMGTLNFIENFYIFFNFQILQSCHISTSLNLRTNSNQVTQPLRNRLISSRTFRSCRTVHQSTQSRSIKGSIQMNQEQGASRPSDALPGPVEQPTIYSKFLSFNLGY